MTDPTPWIVLALVCAIGWTVEHIIAGRRRRALSAAQDRFMVVLSSQTVQHSHPRAGWDTARVALSAERDDWADRYGRDCEALRGERDAARADAELQMLSATALARELAAMTTERDSYRATAAAAVAERDRLARTVAGGVLVRGERGRFRRVG